MNGNLGNDQYMWRGDISNYVTGNKFKQVIKKGDKLVTGNENNVETITADKEEYVRKTPGRYTIIEKKSDNDNERLIINLGKLDSNNEIFKAQLSEMSKKIDGEISKCNDKVDELTTGQISPIAVLKTRYQEVNNIFNVALSINSNDESLKGYVREFQNSFNENIINNEKLTNNSEISNNDLPNSEHLKDIREQLKIDESGNILKMNKVYLDFEKSLNEIVKNQKDYLDKRHKWIEEWEKTKSRYEKTKEFYNDNGIKGFSIKVQTKVVNTTPSSFSNKARIIIDKLKYSTEKV